MGVSRRSVIGGALVSPLLAHAAIAPVASASTAMGTSRDGWIEVLWTRQAQAQWDLFEATMEAIAPAELVERDGRRGLRLPLNSAQGDPSLAAPSRARGTGTLGGGLVVRTRTTEVRVTELKGALQGEQMSGRCMTNGMDAGLRPMFAWHATEGTINVVPGASGEPTMVRVSDLPIRLTPEAMEAFVPLARAHGTPLINTDTVVAHVTAEGRYVPPAS
jgi:hypothetical protein